MSRSALPDASHTLLVPLCIVCAFGLETSPAISATAGERPEALIHEDGFETIHPVELVINEIMQNPAAVLDTAGEWFELYNAGAAPVDINGWTIQDAGTESHVINNGGSLLIPAGGFLVLGNNGNLATNGGVVVDYTYAGIALGNTADSVILLDAALGDVDRVDYDGGATFPNPNGASMSLVDPALDNSVGANWCTATTPYGNGDLGTPGLANDCDTGPASIVINEIMQNPAAVLDTAGEWFELYNAGADPVDINGWTIQDAGTESHVINNGGSLLIPAGGFLVLGNNGNLATNGGVAVDYTYAALTLGNTDDELILLDQAINEVDRVEWDGGPNFPDPSGASMSLVDPGLDNNAGTNWCTAGTPYGNGDLGTPGSINDCVVRSALFPDVMPVPHGLPVLAAVVRLLP